MACLCQSKASPVCWATAVAGLPAAYQSYDIVCALSEFLRSWAFECTFDAPLVAAEAAQIFRMLCQEMMQLSK